MSVSRTEQMVADIIAEFSVWTAQNNYRTLVTKTAKTLLDIESLESLPVISVILGDESVKAQSTSRKTWDSDLDVILLGYIELANMEALVHDLKRFAAYLAVKYTTTSADRWYLSGANPVLKVGRDVLYGTERGWASIILPVHIIAQDATFIG